MSIERLDVPTKDRWNVEALFPSLQDWEYAYTQIHPKEGAPLWKEVSRSKGTLHTSAEKVFETIQSLLHYSRQLHTLYTYAHLKHDEDISDDANKQAYHKISSSFYSFTEETSWIEPELLAMDPNLLSSFLKNPILEPFRFFIEKIIRVRDHILDARGEELIAMSNKPLKSIQGAFSALNDADFSFGQVTDQNGDTHELTHGSYSVYLRSKDRVLRKNSFMKLNQQYIAFENTLCELLSGQIESHVFQSKAHNYSSCLESALFPKNIDLEVYHSLIRSVRRHLPTLHKYVSLRKKILKVDSLHLYDLYVPLIDEFEWNFSYEEAEDAVIASVAPLGKEYQDILKKGLKEERWVDRFENKNKRSGAYSSGCYDSMPYILMNYKGILRDVFTLAHEAGHSMHSLLSHRHQPYQYSDYPIFLAEVASTFNEALLMNYLMNNATSKEAKAFLINEKIEDIRATMIRQTMFAEFELLIHELAEAGTPLTPKILRDHYRTLNEHYFGPDLCIDPEGDIEWARIPHFYYHFYVYQYATGISAALSLSEKVLHGKDSDRMAYLQFLKSGSSRYPIETLRLAGVDMCSEEPIEISLRLFHSLIHQLDTLLH